MANFKIKSGAVQTVKAQLNIELAGGKNPHPWVDPVRALFGSEDKFGDILDFFTDVSHKKSLHQRPITYDELMDLIVRSYDEDSNKTNPKDWQKLLGSKDPVEASAYVTEELNSVAELTKQHYAMICVPSGFDWAARAINMKLLLQDLGWWEQIPLDLQLVWDIAGLLSIWCVYEGLGLGGLNTLALQFHQLVRLYCYTGSLGKLDIPDNLVTLWQECDAEPYKFLETIWFTLMKGEGILPKWQENADVFEVIMFLAGCRELVKGMNNGMLYKEKGAHLRSITLDGLEPEQSQALAAACQLLRDGAKGRLNLQEIQEKSGEVAGVLLHLAKKDSMGLLEAVDSLEDTELSVTSITLLDQYRLMTSWVLGRQSAKERKASGK